MTPEKKDRAVQLQFRTRIFKGALGLILPAFLLIVWELATRFGFVPVSIVAPPSKVLEAFWKLTLDWSLARNAGASLARLLAGLLIGGSTGISVGFLVGARRHMSYLLEPTLTAFVSIPGIAWIPMLIIFFGIGELTNVLLLSIGSFCVLFMETLHGVRSVDKNLVEVAKVLRKNNFTIFLHVLFPGASPSIFAGLKIALALSWTLLVASEMIASSKGLGWLIWNSRNFSRPDEMMVGMITIGLLGKATEFCLTKLQKESLSWRSTFEDLNA